LQRTFLARKREELILENLKVTDNAFKGFAEIIAQKTRDYLMENEKIDPERIVKALNYRIRLAIK